MRNSRRPLPFDVDEISRLNGGRPNLYGEGLGYEMQPHVEQVRARGSVGGMGVSPAPGCNWLSRRVPIADNPSHCDVQPEGVRYGDTATGGPSQHLSVLVWNAGNLDRSGVSHDGVAQESSVLSFICGKHHISLLQEAGSRDAWRTFNSFGIRYAYSSIETCAANDNGYDDFADGSLCILAGGSGRKEIVTLDQASIANPLVSNPEKVRREQLRYFVAEVAWVDSNDPSVSFDRAGKPKWRCCAVHVNNVLAKKPDAVMGVMKQFWGRMLELHVDLVGGDFNGAVNNGVAEGALKEALSLSQHPVEYTVFRNHADDCLLCFCFVQGNLHVSKSSEVERTKARDLHLRIGDKDWHVPLLVTLRLPGRHKRKRPELHEPMQPGLQVRPHDS